MLFEEVLSDARTRADTARRHGQQEANDVQERAAQETQKAVDEILAAAKSQAETRKSQTIALAGIESERERLSAIEAALQSVLARARERLASAGGEAAQQARIDLALDAVAQLPPGEAAEVAAPAGTDATQFAAEIARLAAEQLHRAVDLRPAPGPSGSAVGVVVRTADGRIEIVNSPEERLRRFWPEWRLELAAKLFPETTGDKEK
jgi:vacuolar-type H+-ATPase subunit E/Vma4